MNRTISGNWLTLVVLTTVLWVGLFDPDFVSQSDLLYQIAQLNQAIDKADNYLLDLQQEEVTIVGECNRLAEEVDMRRKDYRKLEDENMNHKLLEIDRKASIMREKHIELTEVNARLESQKLALSLELSDQERLLNGLKSKLAAYQSDEEKMKQDNLKLQKNIEDELKSLNTTEEELKRKLNSREEDTRRKKEDIDRVKTDLQRAKEEHSELLRVWERLKDSGEVLNKKREELLGVVSEQKRLADSADKVKALQEGTKISLESQKKELSDQYSIRIEYLKDENKRRIDTLKRSKEREIMEKQRVLEELKSKYDVLERQEKQYLEQVNNIRQEKLKYQQFAENRTEKDKELQELEQKLDHMRKTLREKVDSIHIRKKPCH
jgi:chromosome segregation ATPase